MEKCQFLGEYWWLVESSLESFTALVQRRELLGPCFGWLPDIWFKYPESMETLWKFLETRPDLLRESDEADTLRRRDQWLEDAIQAKGLPLLSMRDPSIAKNVSKAGTIADLITAAQDTTPEKPPAFSDRPAAQEPAAQRPAAPGKLSPLENKAAAADATVGPDREGPTKKGIIAGRNVPLKLVELDAVLAASDESEEDPVEDALRKLRKAIAGHKTATDAGRGKRLATLLGLCDVYLGCHPDGSKGWAAKRDAVVEGLKADVVFGGGRRVAGRQYLEDAYTKPGQSSRALPRRPRTLPL
jgi:hypothetical protein